MHNLTLEHHRNITLVARGGHGEPVQVGLLHKTHDMRELADKMKQEGSMRRVGGGLQRYPQQNLCCTKPRPFQQGQKGAPTKFVCRMPQ